MAGMAVTAAMVPLMKKMGAAPTAASAAETH